MGPESIWWWRQHPSLQTPGPYRTLPYRKELIKLPAPSVCRIPGTGGHFPAARFPGMEGAPKVTDQLPVGWTWVSFGARPEVTLRLHHCHDGTVGSSVMHAGRKRPALNVGVCVSLRHPDTNAGVPTSQKTYRLWHRLGANEIFGA